ncbi:MAG: hypothetical protein PHP20_02900 [Firmicutes bacterium]|nr:hypothetical protein [Bacillota bacterium]MDD4337423.1 hypothetical protein [Bacillota bacterium]MDD4791987.1 hypothetical protein [Bacillota bacterium]
MTKKYSARPLTEAAVALALGGIAWWLFSPMPGIGPYFKYMSASLIAVIGTRHGTRWSWVTAGALNALVGLTFGLGELVNCLFLVTPIALMLPARQRSDRDIQAKEGEANTTSRTHGASGAKWWTMLLLTYAVVYPARLWVMGMLMGVEISDVISSMASASYHVFEKFWTFAHIPADVAVAGAVKWMWIILPLAGVGYGTMLYLVNRPAYRGGLMILKRTRLG